MTRTKPTCLAGVVSIGSFSVALLSFFGCGGGGVGVPSNFTVQTLVANAAFPSQIRIAPDGRLFYSELRTGKIRIVDNGVLIGTPFATLPVANDNEQGLLGLALDPDFGNNGFLYALYTEIGATRIRIVRLTATGNTGTNLTVVVDDLPISNFHNGGRIGFGQDGMLYVTVGDHEDPANSQNDAVVSGKVLRYTPLGAIPGDNPIPGNPLFTKGHRNCFGITFHPVSGRPYVSENGPDCDDEINRLISGSNYGWRPSQPCNDQDVNFTLPIVRFNPTIAPTGLCFYQGAMFPGFDGDLLMTSFNDRALRRFTIDDSTGALLFSDVVVSFPSGPLLDVAVGNDGAIFLAATTAIYRITPSP